MADETIFRIKERIRQEMRDLLGVTMADGGAIDRQALPAQIDSVAHEVCADFGISDENWIGYIIKSTIDDFIGLGPLQPLQDDPKVAEIFIDPVGVEPNGTFITPVARAEVDGQIVDCPGIDLVSHDEVGRLIGRIAAATIRFPRWTPPLPTAPVCTQPTRRSPPTAGRSISVNSARTS